MQIEGAGAIVFGGASGLGAATVRRLAAAGAIVTIADRDEQRASALAAELGPRAHAVATDVTDATSVEAAVGAVDGLRIAVTCAGVGTPAKLVGRDGPTPLETFARVLEVNLLGTINCLRLTAAAMQANEPDAGGERGLCVNTASIAAYDGQIGQIAYAASKGGVAAVTLPAARELAPSGVRVVTIAPGLFETPMLAGLPEAARASLAGTVPFPARLGDPAEYAELVAHIIANPMLNGEVIRLDGALRMAPR
ncbi:SDR family NAD(P)-dependent oxidoreductase [Conexibacter sp. JD483]|uniref:SDR family NAD(P)-dependent oxidoreductase n=1 Tax=unclassified Conexibacter TaxID=2627773 RepID=UPI0027167004|nr:MULTISPECIES: SDR family NAD(P)-dependent oxidoreductase [unclassified Conexibacter]MDO8189155.1 SDR family NAD(P)-dependent oxidoreductase [Conexibacter sp. CPCC 205706]MDO8200748.1 SDR family NAD(P)-dependent oxidoreductase [Conexibacter sp. CPCC 205762]MDR9369472.1 SDR family NAD(P)-dependent oxidoreductase [Conexibacter sp. JD483]